MNQLTYLDLSGNYIGDAAAQVLAEALKSMNQLTYLDLSINKIRDADAQVLAEALKSMNQLTYLDLSHNYIGDPGAQLLTEVLELHLTNISTLLLKGNEFTELGAKALAKKITNSLKLQKLDLGYKYRYITFQSLISIHEHRKKKTENVGLIINQTNELFTIESTHVSVIVVSACLVALFIICLITCKSSGPQKTSLKFWIS